MMEGLLGGNGDAGSIDIAALQEWGKQLDEAEKDCDTEKLGTLADACGLSAEKVLTTCSDECKALFAFMGEDAGCGKLYDQFGLGGIEELCNGGTFADIATKVPPLPTIDTPPSDATTTTASPDATTESTPTVTTPTITTPVAAKPSTSPLARSAGELVTATYSVIAAGLVLLA